MEIAVLIVIGAAVALAVGLPLLRKRAADPLEFAEAPATPEGRAAAIERIEAEVARYRDAIRAGTVCERCGQANTPHSRFCADCGKPLPNATARDEAGAAS